MRIHSQRKIKLTKIQIQQVVDRGAIEIDEIETKDSND